MLAAFGMELNNSPSISIGAGLMESLLATMLSSKSVLVTMLSQQPMSPHRVECLN